MLHPCCVGTNGSYGIRNQQNLVVPICKQYSQNNTEMFILVPGEFLHSLWHSSPPCLHPLVLAMKRVGSHPHWARRPKWSSIQGWMLMQNVIIQHIDVALLTILAANMNLPTNSLWRLPETAFVFSPPQDSHSTIVTLVIASALEINPWMPKQSCFYANNQLYWIDYHGRKGGNHASGQSNAQKAVRDFQTEPKNGSRAYKERYNGCSIVKSHHGTSRTAWVHARTHKRSSP